MLPVRTLLTILVSCSIWDLGACRFRRKRIIHGKDGLDYAEHAYPAIKYTVWIGDGQLSPKWGFIFGGPIEADPGHQWCGGVLITPTIVQTACTCVAAFHETGPFRPDLPNSWRAKAMTVWEYLLQVFVGDIEVKDMFWMFLAKHYFVYEKCTKIQIATVSKNETYSAYISYDYGLMILEREVTYAPNAKLNYAPSSTFDDIINFYHLALANEYVCLFFGYGNTYEGLSYRTNAATMMWGWRSIMSYQNCYAATVADTLRMDAYKKSGVNYIDAATWVCALNSLIKTNPYEFLTQPQDRGGPVTCNDEYFGVISNHFQSQLQHLSSDDYRPYVRFNLLSPTVFTLWENSVNYRRLFIKDTLEKVSGKTYPDPFDIRIKWKPTYQLFSDSRATYSQSPRIRATTCFILFFASLVRFMP